MSGRFALPPVWRVGLVFIVIVVLTILVILQDVKPAVATTPQPARPATIEVDWLIPGYSGDVAPSPADPTIWEPPQTLYVEESCGVLWIQSDTYKYSTAEQKAIVDGLIAKGTLGRVNGTPEDSKVYLSHEYRQQAPCVQPPAEETPGSERTVDCEARTVTTRSWVDVIRYEGDASGYTALPAVREREASSVAPAEEADCPPVVVPPAPPVELAAAGDEGWLFLGGGAALVMVGGLLKARSRRAPAAGRRRRLVHPDFGAAVRPPEYRPFSTGSLERLPATLWPSAPMPASRHVVLEEDAWAHVGRKDR